MRMVVVWDVILYIDIYCFHILVFLQIFSEII